MYVSRIPTIFPSVIKYGKLILTSDSVCNLGVNLYFDQHMNAISSL